MAHTPAGTSVGNLAHFGQMVMSGLFQYFDFGSAESNRKHYRQNTPPLYHLENVQVPVALFYGQLDILADPQDVKEIISKLRNISGRFEYPDFNHLDFIWGLRAPDEVYSKIIKLIRTNEENQSD